MFTTSRLYSRLAVLSITLAVSVASWSVVAAPPPDPYADAVDPTTGAVVVNPERALGAPDNTGALVVGTVVPTDANDLVLDMGAGEEGTGDLVVYYRGVSTNLIANVAFLDQSRNVITTGRLELLATGDATTSSSTIVPYTSKLTPYRFVRFDAAVADYTVDAVAARTFRPDSDGDGLPDSFEQQYGSDE